jgi:hypothetical protein
MAWSAGAQGAAPQIVKGPYLTGLGEDVVDVRFELDGAAAASVEVFADGEAGAPPTLATAATASGAMHVVHVGGLEAAHGYAYDVRVAGGAPSVRGHFVTAPRGDSGAPVTFLVYGDDRSNEAVHAAIVRALEHTPSDFLVNTGDLVANGGDAADWAAFFRIEAPLLRDRALFLCIGNHELSDDQAGANFARYFGFPDSTGTPQPYGTMRWGSVRIFFLNGMHDWNSGPERQWLEKSLIAADHEVGLVWRLVVLHHSPWSSGPHGGNAKLLDARIPDMLASHGVDLVLAGHDHIYERGTATTKYVITGGGGAPLYPIEHRAPGSRKAESAYNFVELTATTQALKLVARRVDGSVLDECGFDKGKPWDCDAPPPAPTGGTSLAPTPPPEQPSTSRCGCAVPGAAAGTDVWVAGLLGCALLGAGVARRRRG